VNTTTLQRRLTASEAVAALQASPGPWGYDDLPGGGPKEWALLGAKKKGSDYRRLVASGMSKVNAALAVLAVNEFAALVAALEFLRQNVEGFNQHADACIFCGDESGTNHATDCANGEADTLLARIQAAAEEALR
jgi:hypothetical protein